MNIETQILLTTPLDPLCSQPYMGRDVVIENDINEYMYMLTEYKQYDIIIFMM